MMPICGFKGLLGWRCRSVAEVNIGKIATGGKVADRQWDQVHHLCKKHSNKLLKLLGLAPMESE